MYKSTDTLIELIKSLTKAEKRAFNIYVNRHQTATDKNFMKLYNFIETKGYYDENELLVKYPTLKISQLANLKTNLFNQILSSLRILYSTTDPELHVRDLLDHCLILAGKGMYPIALTLIQKAKKEAEKLDNVILLYQCIDLQRRIEITFITSDSPSKIDHLISNTDSIISQLYINNKLTNFSNKLYSIYLKNSYPKNEKEELFLKNIFAEFALEFNELELNILDKIYLYQSYVLYFNMIQDFLNYYKYSYKWLSVFKSNLNVAKSYPIIYLRGYHNCLNALYLSNKRDKFVTLLTEFNELENHFPQIKEKNLTSMYMQYQYIHTINEVFLNGQYKEAIIRLTPIFNNIKKNQSIWDQNKTIVLNYKVACIYFGADDWSTTIDYLNLVTNQPVENFRLDIHAFARILTLISHFELENDLLLAYQIKSVYRFLLKYSDLNSIHKEILKFLRKTKILTKKDYLDEFKSLISKFKTLQQNPYEKRSFLYLDIISWLESKIYNKTISEIIQHKIKHNDLGKLYIP